MIVLTGHATHENLKECLDAGALSYIVKGQESTRDILLSWINRAYKISKKSKEYASLAELYVKDVRVGRWLGRECVSIRVRKINKHVPNFIPTDGWATSFEVMFGQEKEIDDVIEIEHSVIVEQQIGSETKMILDTQIGNELIGKLKGILSEKNESINALKVKHSARVSKRVKLKMSISEPSDYNRKYIIQRSYQWAMKFDKLSCEINLKCSACEIEKDVKLNIYIPTGEISTRILNKYNDGSVDVMRVPDC